MPSCAMVVWGFRGGCWTKEVLSMYVGMSRQVGIPLYATHENVFRWVDLGYGWYCGYKGVQSRLGTTVQGWDF